MQQADQPPHGSGKLRVPDETGEGPARPVSQMMRFRRPRAARGGRGGRPHPPWRAEAARRPRAPGLRANQLVPAETLIDQIWAEEPPEKARNVIQTYVSHLRKALGHDRIQSHGPGYRLRLDPSELDAARFDALMRDAKKTLPVDPNVAVATLEDALALWRGPALADLADQSSLLAEAARLDELRLEAQETRIEGLLAAGVQAPAIGELEALVARHPWREEPVGSPDAGLLPRGETGGGAALPTSGSGRSWRTSWASTPPRSSRGFTNASCSRIPDWICGESPSAATGSWRRSTPDQPGSSSGPPAPRRTRRGRQDLPRSHRRRPGVRPSLRTRMPRRSPPWSIRTSSPSTTTGGSPAAPTSSLATCAGGACARSRSEGSRWSESGSFASSSRSHWRSRSPTARGSRTGTSCRPTSSSTRRGTPTSGTS